MLTFDYPPGFWRWMQNNKAIYLEFVKFAREMKASGRKRYSAKTIVERIRWDTDLRQAGDKTLKINNNVTSGLSRLAMQENPDLRGFFQVRDCIE